MLGRNFERAVLKGLLVVMLVVAALGTVAAMMGATWHLGTTVMCTVIALMLWIDLKNDKGDENV